MTSDSLNPARLQAAAAARLSRFRGRSGILSAAESGNAGLVRDYIVADPAAVHAKDWKYVALCAFFENYSMNPVSTVPSNFPLHI